MKPNVIHNRQNLTELNIIISLGVTGVDMYPCCEKTTIIRIENERSLFKRTPP